MAFFSGHDLRKKRYGNFHARISPIFFSLEETFLCCAAVVEESFSFSCQGQRGMMNKNRVCQKTNVYNITKNCNSNWKRSHKITPNQQVKLSQNAMNFDLIAKFLVLVGLRRSAQPTTHS